MNKTLGMGALLFSCSVAACSGYDGSAESGEAGEAAGEIDSAIVRADSEGGSRAAVAVVAETIFGGFLYCSGVAVGPRVVITAAHCLRDTVGRLTVYYGPDASADKEEFGDGDDTTKPWVGAETWIKHPDYDPDLHYPDLGVVYLKRSLPFQPAKLARFPLTNASIGKQLKIVGWGASLALTPDISEFEGVGIQRTAKVPFLGSPTTDDFVPADPNNGLFVPQIRADLAKFDGTAPESNSCAGDSGAPIFASKDGDNYVVAINFFTGLSCEGYSMATRVKPFLPFLDAAIEKGGALPLEPTLRCVDKSSSGVYTAYFGYQNENVVSLDVPYGRNNELSADTDNARPTHFSPGDHPFSFFLDFSKRDKLKYTLGEGDCHGRGNESVTASSNSPRCDANAADVACGRSCRALDVCAIEGYPFASCMTDCLSNLDFFEQNALPQCVQPFAALQRCLAAVPSADLCNFDNPPAFCVDEMASYDACFTTE